MSQPSVPPPGSPAPAAQRAPEAAARPGAAVAIPELLQTSITLLAKPSNPPFGVVRGRGKLTMALAYVGIAGLVVGLVSWALSLALYHQPGRIAWHPFLSAPLGVVGGFAAFVFFIGARLKMSRQTRDDFATSAALYWAPLVLAFSVLGALAGGINGLSIAAPVAGVALILTLAGFSLLALKTMFNNAYEQTFRLVAYGLIINSLVASLVTWLIDRL